MDFQEVHPGEDPYRFAEWLLRQAPPKGLHPQLAEVPPTAQEIGDMSLNRDAGILISRLNRFARYHIKPLFEGHPLSLDEMYFLGTIQELGRPNKKELCLACVTEISTGQDIIRRLVTQGWVTEHIDESDRRAKRLSITPSGEAMLMESVRRLWGMRVDLLGDLPSEERVHLIDMMKRLDLFHYRLFQQQENA